MNQPFSLAVPDFPESGCAVVFGASGGIGASTAALLARQGCDVVLTYGSRRSDTEQLAAVISANGGGATALACDITDAESTRAVIQAAASEFGGVHTVITATGMHFATALWQT